MNLRTKNLLTNLIVASILAISTSTTFASAKQIASNKISFPVAISFPARSSAIDDAVIRLTQKHFLNGFDVSQNLDDVVIRDPFEIRLKGVAFKTRIQGRLDRDASGLIAEASLISPEVTIDSILINSVVKTRVAGVEARIRIDANCKASRLSWSGQSLAFFTRVKLLTDPSLAVVISQLALPVDLPKPVMQLKCTGPAGIEDLVRDYAWASLKQRWAEESFALELELQIQKFFSEAMRIGGEGLKVSNQANFKLRLNPTSYSATKFGSHLRATLDLEIDRPISVRVKKGSELILPEGLIENVTVTAPVSAAETLVQNLFAPGVWSDWLDAQAISGFRELMSSRFKQFIAFPDLMNYDKDAPFWFVLGLENPPSVRCGPGGLDISAPLHAKMLLQDSSLEMGYKALVSFQLPTRLAISFPRATEAKTMSAQVTELDLTGEFDNRYVETENPNTSIAFESILPEVRDYADSKTQNLTTLDGALGESVRWLNETDISCAPEDQMLRLKL